MKKFKEEIHNYLNETLELDLKTLEKNVNATVLKYFNCNEIYDYWVVCDATNNPPYVVANNFMNIDVYFQKDKISDTLCYNITMKVDKIKNLQKKRQKKLEKLYDIR
jgi:hypothetical protein